ncbi:N-6 DNA methylase, partial [Glycomyces paridis]
MTTRNTAPGATVTLTDLARLAGVGRNAVSNWRRREPDFPTPVDESARRPRFSLPELETWAAAHGRDLHVTDADRLWFHLAADHATPESALEAVAAALDGRGDASIAKQLNAIEVDASALFEFFIERAREAAGTGLPPGIGPLADIAAAIQGVRAETEANGGRAAASRRADAAESGTAAPADPNGGRSAAPDTRLDDRGSAPRVHDPACDEGDLLAAVARRIGHCAALTGRDLSPARADITARRLALLDPDAEVAARVGDALLEPLGPGRYDLVVCDPPFNLKDWGHDRLPAGDDPRLAYGTPPRTEPELAWALHCAALLAPGGHAVVRMPAQVAHRRTGRRIRSELLRWGVLRAVVDHPDAKAHLWILGPSGEAAQLLVSNGRDFSAAWRAFTADPNAPIATADSATIPLMRLWDEDVDISPAVYLAGAPGDTTDLAADIDALTERLTALAAFSLPRFSTGTEESAPETSLADLERDGHLRVAPGGVGGFEATGGIGGTEGAGGSSGTR